MARSPAYIEGEVTRAFPLDASVLNKITVQDVFGKSSPPDRWVETLRNDAAEGERNNKIGLSTPVPTRNSVHRRKLRIFA